MTNFTDVFPITYTHISTNESETKLLTSLLFFEMSQKDTWVCGVEWDFKMTSGGRTITTFYVKYLEKHSHRLEAMLHKLDMHSSDMLQSIREQWAGYV